MISKIFYDMLPALLFCMGIVCIFFTFSFKVKKTVRKHQQEWSSYLEEDSAANFVRKKNIPSELLLTVKMDKIPSVSEEEADKAYIGLKRFENIPMCTLPDLTNLELKQRYGYQGFQKLIQYEQSYTLFMDELIDYALVLKEKDYLSDAMATLEYAVTLGSDKSICYLTLIEIYGIMKDRIKLEWLQTFIVQNLSHCIYYKDIQDSFKKCQSELKL